MKQRLERINNVIREEISNMLLRDLHDPLIGFVSITDVEVSPDLRHAKVFFSVLGDEEQVKNSIKGLLRARKFINSRLAERVELRYIPHLRFVLDETASKAMRLDSLISTEGKDMAEALARHQAEDAAAAAAAAEAGEAAPEPRDELDELDELDDLDDEKDEDEDFDDEADEDEDFEDEEDEPENLDPIR